MRAVLCLSLAAAILAAGVPARAADAVRGQEHFDEALNHYRAGNFGAAMSSLSKSIALNSRYKPAYALRAHLRHIVGDLAGMRRDLKPALRMQTSRNPEWLVLRGNARLLAGDTKAAVADYNSAIEIDEEYADAWLGRGRIYRSLGYPKKAVAEWITAIKLDPDLLLTRYNLAWAYYELGKPGKAVKEMVRTLNKNPNFPLPYGLLGVIFAEKGDTTRALKAYSKALYLQPENRHAIIGRGLVYLKLASRTKSSRKKASYNRLAFKDFSEAVRIAGIDYAPFYNRGEVRYRLGKKTKALADFRQALRFEIPDPEASLAMGARFAGEKSWADAAAMYTKTLGALNREAGAQKRRRTERALLGRAAALEQLEKYRQALRDLDLAVKVSSASALTWTARGKVLHKIGKTRTGFQDLNVALSIDPNHAPALLARGNILAQARKYEEALKDLKGAVKNDPSLADAHNNLGVLYASAFERYANAAAHLGKAAALDPKNAGFRLNHGVALFQNRDYWKSIKALNLALKLRAPVMKVLEYRAQAYYALGDSVHAFNDIREAIKLSPKTASFHAALGSFYLKSHNTAKAIKVLNKAIALDKKGYQAHLARGLAYGARGRYSRASSNFRSAARRTEKPAEALTHLCWSERLRGRLRGAVAACNRAQQADPDHGPAYTQRGLAFLAIGDFPKAVRDIDDGARLGPLRAEALLARSLAHIPLKQFRASDAAYRKAISLDETARFAEITLGEDPDPKWDYQTWAEKYAKLVEANADNPHSYLVRGNALHSVGYYDRAILEYTRAMEIKGNLAAAYMNRGTALAAQESLDAAEHDLRRAVSLKPDDPATHLALVTLLTSRRKYTPGLKAVIGALRKQQDNPNPDTFVKAGNLRYFLKDIPAAAENFRLALKFDNNHAAAHNGLGLCLFSQRRYRPAQESFSRAIAIDPESHRYYRNRASTFVNQRDFPNAAGDYRRAQRRAKTPEGDEEYEKLFKKATNMIPGRRSRASGKSVKTPASSRTQ